LICISAQEKKKERCTKNEKDQKQSTTYEKDQKQSAKKKATKGNKPKLRGEKKNLGVDVPSSSAPKIGHAKRRVQTTKQRLKATMKKQEQRGRG
jgi:hypothetical protein